MTRRPAAYSRYSEKHKRETVAKAEPLLDAGLSVRATARALGMGSKTLRRWLPEIWGWGRGHRDPLVDWDGDCWRIYVFDPPDGGWDPRLDVCWWPILWLRFGSRELAEDHLELYGCP